MVTKLAQFPLPLNVTAPLFITLPPALTKGSPPLLRLRLPLASIVNAPLLVVLPQLSCTVGAARSTVPPAELPRLRPLRYRVPPPPTIVFRCPVLVKPLAVHPVLSTL